MSFRKKKESTYTVYKYTTPSGKVYIGQTSNSIRRRRDGGYKHNKHFSNAIRKYGWENITEEVLGEGLSLEEANLLETFYIESLDARDMDHGYNILPGGMAMGSMTEDVRERIQKHTTTRKPVVCVETGEWFASIAEAERLTGIPRRSIRHVLAGRRKTAHKYHWRYSDDNGGSTALHECEGAEKTIRIREVEHSHDDVGG